MLFSVDAFVYSIFFFFHYPLQNFFSGQLEVPPFFLNFFKDFFL